MNFDNWMVVILGIGTVFVGLICIVAICYLMSYIMQKTAKAEAVKPQALAVASAQAVIPNRREMIAAVSAAIAEDLGTDISAIRIISVKKL